MDLKIFFSTVADIEKFVDIVQEISANMDLEYGNMSVDAKSLLGVCAIGTGKVITLKAYGEIQTKYITQLEENHLVYREE